MTPPLVTLLTDFGLDDGYVGAMKGVVLAQASAARLVDICHRIPAQDVRQGGLVWASAVPFFPPGTIHVAVVDPGVGGRRRILAAEARDSFFIVPDNGILGFVATRRQIRRVVRVCRGADFLEPVSSTFHGRDLFAPAAAYLARGGELGGLGNAVRSYRLLAPPRPTRRLLRDGRVRVRGEVLTVDRFGNAVTNLTPLPGAVLQEVRCGGCVLRSLAASYSSVRAGRPMALVSSGGTLELAVRDGSAAERFRICATDAVVADWR